LSTPWPLARLGAVCSRMTVGHVGPMVHEYVESGTPFLRSQNIKPFQIDLTDVKFVSSSFARRLSKSALRPGDVAVVRTGYPGTATVIPDTLPIANCADLVVITTGPTLDSYFLAALLNSTWGLSAVSGRLVGSAQQHFNVAAARSLEVRLPPLATQRKIAAILSAYNDLIENNNRRIKLLEEMAQRIYREWFVDFRYPGHESVPLVDSNLGRIPRGWTTDALGTVVKVNALTAKSLSSFDMIHYIDISSVERGSVTERRRVAAVDAPGRARRLVRDGDVIWSTVRPNLRAYALMLDPPSSCVVSTGFAVLSPEWVPFAFLYGLSATDSFVGYLTNHATGSAYPAVTGRTFAEMPIVIPDADLLQRYSTIAEPMLRLSSRLQEAQSILRDTRDLLLPRLISGDIDVDELNIEVPDAA